MKVISPENISGFVVGKGHFYAEYGQDIKYKLGYRIRAIFYVEVGEEDIEILESMKYIFGCGNIISFKKVFNNQKKWKKPIKYKVSNQSDIFSKVIPFFEKYPLFGQKLKVFNIFAKIVYKIKFKDHLTQDGLKEIHLLVSELQTMNKKGLEKC